jgi:hypothetical protein
VERRDRAVELDDAHEAEAAGRADRRLAAREIEEALVQAGADAVGVVDHALAVEDLDGADGSGAADRVGVLRQAAHEAVVVEVAGDRRRHRDRRQRRVARGQALAEDHHVGADVPVLAREPPSRPAEAAEDLVVDQQDAVLVAQLADPRPEIRRRELHAVGAGEALEQDRGDRRRILAVDQRGQAGDPRRGLARRARERVVDVERWRGSRRNGCLRGSPATPRAASVAPW